MKKYQRVLGVVLVVAVLITGAIFIGKQEQKIRIEKTAVEEVYQTVDSQKKLSNKVLSLPNDVSSYAKIDEFITTFDSIMDRLQYSDWLKERTREEVRRVYETTIKKLHLKKAQIIAENPLEKVWQFIPEGKEEEILIHINFLPHSSKNSIKLALANKLSREKIGFYGSDYSAGLGSYFDEERWIHNSWELADELYFQLGEVKEATNLAHKRIQFWKSQKGGPTWVPDGLSVLQKCFRLYETYDFLSKLHPDSSHFKVTSRKYYKKYLKELKRIEKKRR